MQLAKNSVAPSSQKTYKSAWNKWEQFCKNINTMTAATMRQVILATGISMAFFLCLRSSEYVSRTIAPIEDSHQFLSADVEFMLNDGTKTFIASN
jgi:hypothetical protein